MHSLGTNLYESELEMTSLHTSRILLALFALCGFGCEPAEIKITKKASYSDLVVTFNAEVQTLDNLEGKRKTLIAEYAEKAQADAFKSALNSFENSENGFKKIGDWAIALLDI